MPALPNDVCPQQWLKLQAEKQEQELMKVKDRKLREEEAYILDIAKQRLKQEEIEKRILAKMEELRASQK